MSLKEKLMEDLKSAMRNRDKLRKDTITMVRAAIRQKEVDDRVELNDQDVIDILTKQLKEKKHSIEEFKKGDRQDLIEQTNKEIDVLLDYLPKQLGEDELRQIIQEVMTENNINSVKDMGTLMKHIMPKVKGKADGNTVSKIAKELLK